MKPPILRDPNQITIIFRGPTKEIADGNDLYGDRVKLSVRKKRREAKVSLYRRKSQNGRQNFEPQTKKYRDLSYGNP